MLKYLFFFLTVVHAHKVFYLVFPKNFALLCLTLTTSTGVFAIFFFPQHFKLHYFEMPASHWSAIISSIFFFFFSPFFSPSSPSPPLPSSPPMNGHQISFEIRVRTPRSLILTGYSGSSLVVRGVSPFLYENNVKHERCRFILQVFF